MVIKGLKKKQGKKKRRIGDVCVYEEGWSGKNEEERGGGVKDDQHLKGKKIIGKKQTTSYDYN